MRRGGIGTLFSYDNFEQVGEGTYGYVFKAKNKLTNEIVALKRIIFQKDSSGFPLFALREIKLLKSLHHPNIVNLLEVISSKGCEDQEEFIKVSTLSKNTSKPTQQIDSLSSRCGNTYIVFEYLDHDVGGLIDIKFDFSFDQIRVIMKQLFEALSYLHERGIFHRDIKSSNLLLNNRFQLKLGDFGLARELYPVPHTLVVSGLYGPPVPPSEVHRPELTNNVITSWYRPPELLLGEKRYTSSVDIWSAGCVMGEMLLGRPMFPGKTDLAQLELIMRSTGIPNEESWPGVSQLPNFSLVSGISQTISQSSSYFAPPNIRIVYEKRISEPSLSFLDRLLVLDPNKRLSARVALTNSYFYNCPEPTSLPVIDSSGKSYHEFQTKSKRREQAANIQNSPESQLLVTEIVETNDISNKSIIETNKSSTLQKNNQNEDKEQDNNISNSHNQNQSNNHNQKNNQNQNQRSGRSKRDRSRERDRSRDRDRSREKYRSRERDEYETNSRRGDHNRGKDSRRR